MISKGAVGFSSRHFGSCGTSHLLANALGLVTRSGACTSSSANNATAEASASKPLRKAG
jgi:hypothetical protein